MEDLVSKEKFKQIAADVAESVASSRRKIYVDYEKYALLLNESELNDEEKREVIDALWSIIVAFVDLGFGVHPMQEVCGKDAQNGADSALEPSKALYLDSETPHNDIGSPPGRDST